MFYKGRSLKNGLESYRRNVTVKMNVPLGDGSAKAWGETGCTVWDEWSQQ